MKKLIIIICVLFFHLTQWKTYAQHVQISEEDRRGLSLLSLIGDDMWHVISKPAEISLKDALLLTGFTAFNIFVIHQWDESIDHAFANHDQNRYFDVVDNLADLGDSYDVIPLRKFTISAAMLAAGFAFKDKKLMTTSRLAIEALILNEAITQVGKRIFGRTRPYVGQGPKDLNFLKFSEKSQYQSFPSGHTSGIFTLATVVSKQYNKWWIKYPSYIIALSVALQRMDDQKHWASDTIAGAALGYWIGSTLVNRYNDKKPSVSYQPFVKSNGIGLAITF